MTLTDLIARHPDLFYRQDWYRGEAFMHYNAPPNMIVHDAANFGFRPCADPLSVMPREADLPMAVALAMSYVKEPGALLWRHYLWCRETDHLGQRIFVGGVSPENGMRFEIHRHLAITEQWGIAVWQ